MPFMLADQPPPAGGGDDSASSALFGSCPFDLAMVSPRSAMPAPTSFVLLGLGALFALISLCFVPFGAWPVLVFSELDLLLLGVALHAFRRREPPSERLTLEGGMLVHVVRDGTGYEDRAELPAYWTRLVMRGDTALLRFRDQRRPLCRCLGQHDRRAVIALLQTRLPAC